MLDTGAFLGTFDPLHGGHIGQLLRAHKAKPLSQILILVDEHPSHKPNASSLEHRIKMAELTLGSLDLPFKYTVKAAKNENLSALAGMFTYRIVGIDSVISDIQKQRWGFLTTWHMVILSIPNVPRSYLTGAIATLPKDIVSSFSYTYVDEAAIPMMNYDFESNSFISARVHSTELRARGRTTLIPSSTRQYIQQHQLYT